MAAKRAKLNLDFGHTGICMNLAIEPDIQARNGVEADWRLISIKLDHEAFAEFPGNPQDKILNSDVQKKAEIIEEKIKNWQKEHGYDFDSFAEVTVSASCFEVLSFPYAPGFESKIINEEDIKKIELCKNAEIPMPNNKIKTFISPYFLISNGNDLIKVLDPRGKKTKNLGFHAYFITEHPMLSKLINIMKNDGDKINISLSCEKEFRTLASDNEKGSKTLLINITDSITEFSIWDNSELKYLNKKETGLKVLKNLIWRLCLYYHIIEQMAHQDYELTQNEDTMRKFYETARKVEIQDDSKELLSADDCSELLQSISCILENETEYSIKFSRLALPGRNRAKTNASISNYILSYFAREAVRSILTEIKQTIDNDNFCEPKYVILECSLPLKGIDKLATEIFRIPVRRGVARWDGDIKEDFSAAGIGALQDLISGEYQNSKDIRKKTSKFTSLINNFFNRA
ncbi:MAG: cell division FtsA domain-containing protein [Fibromonadaceae bacterium]|nr:cell division FtsA domain-containing protein [Fibromonadaceae bacterium]